MSLAATPIRSERQATRHAVAFANVGGADERTLSTLVASGAAPRAGLAMTAYSTTPCAALLHPTRSLILHDALDRHRRAALRGGGEADPAWCLAVADRPCCAPGPSSGSALDEHVDALEARVARAVQPRAAGDELAQVGDRLGRDALARAAAPGCPAGSRRSTRTRRARRRRRRATCSASPRNASRGATAISLRSVAGGRTIGAIAPSARDPLDDLLDVAGQAPQRLAPLAEADEEDDRRLRGELGDGRRRSAAARRRPRSRCGRCSRTSSDDPQRVVAGDARAPDEARVDQRDAGDRRELRARDASIACERLVQQLLAVQRELAPRAVERGEQQRRRAGRAHQPHARGRRRRRRCGRCGRRGASRSGSASPRSCACS